MLSDILPTSFECGVLNGKVEPGSTVAIVGAGPGSRRPAHGPVLLAVRNHHGRCRRQPTRNGQALWRYFYCQQHRRKRRGRRYEDDGKRGVDTAIEAVGVPATFELSEKIVTAGGHIANIGVHGKKVDLHLENLWDRNISITTRLVDTATIPMLFKTVSSHKIDPAAADYTSFQAR